LKLELGYPDRNKCNDRKFDMKGKNERTETENLSLSVISVISLMIGSIVWGRDLTAVINDTPNKIQEETMNASII
jgi:hypothetical protein